MIQDDCDMAWIREVYFSPTSTKAQIASAWKAAEAIISKYCKGCW